MNYNIAEPTILCMFSGGLDSLGMLYTLLTNNIYNDYMIMVYHIHIKNAENRAVAEAVAVNKIIKYLRENKYKPFMYAESIHECHSINQNIPRDVNITNFVSGNICHDAPLIKAVALGRTKTDDDRDVMIDERLHYGYKIFDILKLPHQEKIYPIQHLLKKDIYDMLPHDLRSLAWSCRIPKYSDSGIEPCGKCFSCKEMKEIL
jgi:7-cyano-7-deazaguanine synthase in queuosine biosynthesis